MSKIALVTGVNRGLGHNTALSISRGSGDVIVAYRSNAAQAEDVVGEIKAHGREVVAIRLDVSELAGFSTFARNLQRCLSDVWGRDSFDHLVKNAGHGKLMPFAETTEAPFNGLFDVHVKGVYFLMRALLPLIADGRRIVNFLSALTRFSAEGFSAYVMAKGANEGLTRHLAKELGPHGIAVNKVAPGAIETDFGGGIVRNNGELNALYAGMTALGRVGVPDDIGPMVARLLSDDNRWVTGRRIEVSGGQAI